MSQAMVTYQDVDNSTQWRRCGKPEHPATQFVAFTDTAGVDAVWVPAIIDGSSESIVVFMPDMIQTQTRPDLPESNAAHHAWSSEYGADEFELVGKTSPALLPILIEKGSLRPDQLTFAAESLGRWCAPADAIPLLEGLLSSDDSIVREGAVAGLALHPGSASRELLQRLLQTEESDDVRLAAEEAIEEM